MQVGHPPVATGGERPYVPAGKENIVKPAIGILTDLMPAAALAAVLGLIAAGPVRGAEPIAAKLAAHRAVYDLTLARTRGNSQIQAVRGRILYDFNGSACEGYTLNFRQLSELDTGEGKVAVSDLRSTTWEDAAGKQFRFSAENNLNERQVESVEGEARRRSDAIAVTLTKPNGKNFDLETKIVFPTEHMGRIIEAARAQRTLLELPVFDGSENGEKVYNTLTVIGPPIPPNERKPADAAAGQAVLEGLTRWPTTISYFDRSKTAGEQTPVYAITFELYENGISRALSLDYTDFVIKGEMTTLEIKDSKSCP